MVNTSGNDQAIKWKYDFNLSMRSRTLPARGHNKVVRNASFANEIDGSLTSIRCLEIPRIGENRNPNHGSDEKVVNQNEWYNAPEILPGARL